MEVSQHDAESCDEDGGSCLDLDLHLELGQLLDLALQLVRLPILFLDLHADHVLDPHVDHHDLGRHTRRLQFVAVGKAIPH